MAVVDIKCAFQVNTVFPLYIYS